MTQLTCIYMNTAKLVAIPLNSHKSHKRRHHISNDSNHLPNQTNELQSNMSKSGTINAAKRIPHHSARASQNRVHVWSQINIILTLNLFSIKSLFYHSVLNSNSVRNYSINRTRQPPANISADRPKNPSQTLADKYTVRKFITSDSKVPGERDDVYSWRRCRLNRIIPKRRQVGVTHRVCQVGFEHKISQ